MTAIPLLHEAPLTAEVVTSREIFNNPPGGTDVLLIPEQDNAIYCIGYATSKRCVEKAQRLRYRVFNEELGEGLMTSVREGLDRDEFDDQMHHIVLIKRSTGNVVGTYRLQTMNHGLATGGIYCGQEYDLAPMAPYHHNTVECGRACVEEADRNYSCVMLLWKAITHYCDLMGARYVFGCCSLTTNDPDDGWRALRTLRERGALHSDLLMHPMPDHSCGDPSLEFSPSINGGYKIPKLFRAYLALGGKVASLPAIDRAFGTVDFIVMVDRTEISFMKFLMRH